MPTVNFYLKEPKSKDESLIYLFYFSEAFKLKISTGEKINPKLWNSDTQRAKKGFNGYSDFNNFLEGVAEETKRIPRAAIGKGKAISKDEMKELVLQFLGKQGQQNELSFFEALTQFQELKKGKLSTNFLKSVKTLENHLRQFETKSKYKISFEKINLAFYELFTSYLQNEKQQTNNTIGTNISRLKNFLNWAEQMQYNKFEGHKAKDFKSVSSDTEIIYLTEKELVKLYEFKLPLNSKLNKVRESFCLSCFTGLRFSDVSKIHSDDIKGDEILLTTQKTKEISSIPLNEFALNILQRNDFVLTPISNQKTNQYLKELGELVGINDPVKFIRFKGSERIEKTEPKFNLLTSHVARKTFVTLSLEKGMRPETVMAITGHKSYKSFKRYFKISDIVKRSEMKRIWNNPSNQLKVVNE